MKKAVSKNIPKISSKKKISSEKEINKPKSDTSNKQKISASTTPTAKARKIKTAKPIAPKPEVINPAESLERVHVVLQLNYHTQKGESVWVTSDTRLLGDSPLKQMQYEDNDHWKIQLFLRPEDFREDIAYHYFIRNEDGSFQEDDKEKILSLTWLEHPHAFVRDYWGFAGYSGNVFYKRPFDFLLDRPAVVKKSSRKTKNPNTHLFEVKVPYLPADTAVFVQGDVPELGDWKSDSFVKLIYNQNKKEWISEISIQAQGRPIAYKYGYYNIKTGKIARYEDGENRTTFSWLKDGVVVQNDGFIHLPQTEWKGAGINIPLFSIRTEKDYGIGDLGSVPDLVNWMSAQGFHLLQLLPINDTSMTQSWTDSYPYAALSAFALHPIYVDVEKLLSVEIQKKAEVKELLAEGKALNKLSLVDYEAVYTLKIKILQIAFADQKTKVIASKSFKTFVKENAFWLNAYAAFCVLRDRFHTSDFSQWKDAAVYSDKVFSDVEKKDKTSLQFYQYTQYVLHQQLLSVKDYAHQHKVVLKGDIPIGVGRHSADVWEHPTLFHVNMQAGAPPDFFVKEGQNWGFPTYNWEVMERDNYSWWKSRLEHTSQYFDTIRLDHILGFFRIWSIPYEQVQGILGYFIPDKPIDQFEFSTWNIPFDYDRYCKPFITDAILWELFGDDAKIIAPQFLEPNSNGSYHFKAEYNSQRTLQQAFSNSDLKAELLPGLLSLMANVLLVPDKEPGKYHCRFVMYETSSYKTLSDWEKKQLYYLYVDYFFERQENGWMQSGQKKLHAIAANTDMMVCGEDLGMVPASVPVVMDRLGYLGLRVQRMSSDSHSQFTDPHAVGYLHVVTPSTHDVAPIRNWWNSESVATKNSFWQTQLFRSGEASQVFDTDIAEGIIKAHLESPAIWSIFLMQDIFSLDEKTWNLQSEEDLINRPEITPFYWRYRMHLSVDQLEEMPDFNKKIKKLLQLSNR